MGSGLNFQLFHQIPLQAEAVLLFTIKLELSLL